MEQIFLSKISEADLGGCLKASEFQFKKKRMMFYHINKNILLVILFIAMETAPKKVLKESLNFLSLSSHITGMIPG